jgi:hypothetical protein
MKPKPANIKKKKEELYLVPELGIYKILLLDEQIGRKLKRLRGK